MSLRVKLNFSSKLKEETNGINTEEENTVEIISDEDSDNGSIPPLPEGTAVVYPEPVIEKKPVFRGPEFKSSSSNSKKKGKGDGGGGASSTTVLENLFCTACGRQINPWKTGMVKRHKELKVLICRKCYNFLGSGEIGQDEDGMDEQCRWCGEGGRLTICDKCPHAFCKGCIMRNFGRKAFTAVTESSNWECYCCDPGPLDELRKHCRSVLDAVSSDKAGSSNSSQPAVATRSSSRTAPSRTKPASHDRSQPAKSPCPESLLSMMATNFDLHEDNIVSVTEKLTESVSQFRQMLESVKHAVGNDEADNDGDESLISFSSDASPVQKKQQCAKALKKELQTFFTSLGQILKQNNVCVDLKSASLYKSVCNGDVNDRSSHLNSEAQDDSSSCSNSRLSVEKFERTHEEKKSKEEERRKAEKEAREKREKEKEKKKKEKERREKEKEKEERRKERERRQKAKEREEKRKEKERREKKKQLKSEKVKHKETDDSETDEEEKEVRRKVKVKTEKELEQSDSEESSTETKHRKSNRKTSREAEDSEEEESEKETKRTKGSKKRKEKVEDSEDESSRTESKKGSRKIKKEKDESEDQGTVSKKKDEKHHVSPDQKSHSKKAKESAGKDDEEGLELDMEVENVEEYSIELNEQENLEEMEKTDEDASQAWTTLESTDDKGAAVPINDSQDLSQQEENLFAKLELIQELAEEFCKESQANKESEKDAGKEVKDAEEDDINSDDEDELLQISFGAALNDTNNLEDESDADMVESSLLKEDDTKEDESEAENGGEKEKSFVSRKGDNASDARSDAEKGRSHSKKGDNDSDARSDAENEKSSLSKKGNAASEAESDTKNKKSSNKLPLSKKDGKKRVDVASDVSDADSDTDRHSTESKKVCKKDSSSSRKRKKSDTKDDKCSPSKVKKSKVKTPTKKGSGKDENAQKTDDSDGGDDSSTDLFHSSDDEEERRSKRKSRTKKRTKQTASKKDEAAESEDSSEEADGTKKTKRHVKSSSKKSSHKKQTQSESDEEDDDAEENKPKKEKKKEPRKLEKEISKALKETGKTKKKDKDNEEDEDAKEDDGSDATEGEKPKKKIKKEVDSDEEDEMLEKEVSNLLKGARKAKKKKKDEDEESEEDNDEAAEEKKKKTDSDSEEEGDHLENEVSSLLKDGNKSKKKKAKDGEESEEEEQGEEDEENKGKKLKKKVKKEDDDASEEEEDEEDKEAWKGKGKSKKKKDKDEEESGEENEDEKATKKKSMKKQDSEEEDEKLEKETSKLLKEAGKKKKKKAKDDEDTDDSEDDKKDQDKVNEDSEDDSADDETQAEKNGKKSKVKKEKTESKGKKGKKKKDEEVSSDSSDDDDNQDTNEEEDMDDSDEDVPTKASEDLKKKKKMEEENADLENELAKAAMFDEIDSDNDADDDKNEQEEDSSSSESDIGAVRKRRAKKPPGEKEPASNKSESLQENDKYSDDSDFEPVSARKRFAFKSKLLDAKVSGSDSDSDIKRPKKGKKRKRDSDDESFDGNKCKDDDDDDDGGDSVVDSDEVSSGSGDSDDSSSGKKKGKKKGKKGKGKEKGKKRKRIKKMDSSSEAEALEGEDKGEDPTSRKKIRKIKSDKKLDDSTKAAARAEEERRRRVAEKQEKFNGKETKDAGDGQAPITTKLVLEQDEETKEPLIQVNPKLICKLKPHQVEAVQFMWDCLFESLERCKKPEASAGCILAHCMGLGKTLSVVSFVHTVMSHKKLTKVKRCLVVSPLNTVLNWQNEFDMWLEEKDKLDVYELSSVKQNNHRADLLEEWHRDGGILIMGYEMLRNLSQGTRVKNKKQKAIFHKTLVDPGPEIVVCDEGHLMKNAASALSKAVNQIKTRRRIVLTGTPLQNNLVEYHCMVDFVKPKLLGTKKEFANRFVNPIINGQHSDSTGRDVRVMKHRAHVLHELLAGCVQRRDYSALTKFLPPKQEYVISVRLSEMQMSLYEEYLNRSGQVDGQITSKGARLFKDYQNLMKIWTHPWVLKLAEIRDESKVRYDDNDSFIDDEDSNEQSFNSSSSSSESEKAVSDDDSAGEGTSSGHRSKRLRKKKSGSDRDEVVNDWKTRSRGGEADDQSNDTAESSPQAVSGEWWAEYVKEEDQHKMEHSGKLMLLFDILRMCEEIGDKVLIFSQSLLSLDIIEYFLEQVDTKFTEDTQDQPDEELKEQFGKRWVKGEDYFRMDGSTSAQMRQHWASIFNDPDNLQSRLFLISTRAGGLGINLVGANRVIIFDASWNPSHDVQSIFRVYRFGQTKPCYIYRFLAQGTMEEKIYDRQVTKLSLSQRVVDEHQVERHFTAADLSELYAFRPDRLSDESAKKTLMLPKDVLLAEIMSGEQKDWFVSLHEHDSLLENLVEQELSEEEKKAAWEDYENDKKGLRMDMGPAVLAGAAGLGSYLSQDFLLKTAQALREKHPDMTPEVLQQHLQRIIMMQIRQKQEEQRRLDMLERQQNTQFMQMQQHYAQLQQQYMQQMGQQTGRFGMPRPMMAARGARYPGMMAARGRGFMPFSRAAAPSSMFYGGAAVAAMSSGKAGTSEADPVEVIDLDESND
ncbi:uncharacterized protein LOC143283763 [Babylonia areolata]|uniref:uncharacterized protein LOC143283763 n=1 Tax=Babylonia areolata TaxID=304850 RepID=UPI003FD125C7